MKNRLHLITATLIVTLFINCSERNNINIDYAYQLLDSNPDSALTVLASVNQKKLSTSERARYALVYTIAQDKSGLDVDNDSLLNFAYTYYNDKENDSLFAKCQYYTGKYYALNAKNEFAVECYEKAIDAAERQGDKHTQCLALEKLSIVRRNSNPEKATRDAQKAVDIYNTIRNHTPTNLFYFKLNLADALLFNKQFSDAEKECLEAIEIAKTIDDSSMLAFAYQDMSLIMRKQRKISDALNYIRKSYDASEYKDNSLLLNMANVYLLADSLGACKSTIDHITAHTHIEEYTLLCIKHLLAIKNHDYVHAISFADSAYNQLEKMYAGELKAKEQYYSSLVDTQYEKGIVEGHMALQNTLNTIVAISSIVVIGLLVFSFRQYKQKTQLQTIKNRAEAEKKLIDEEMKHKDLMLMMQKAENEREVEQKLHEEKMRYKEVQLATMRKYILSKISISQKIEELKGNKDKAVCLTDTDWEEIKIFIENTEGGFVLRLRESFPDLTEDDLRFMMLIRLNMPSKAMSHIYGISDKSICQKLFVYKTKVGIGKQKGTSLRDFIISF